MIDEFIKKKLKEKYGTHKNKWWLLGVPPKIQKDCAGRQIDTKSPESPDQFLTTIDYKDIIYTPENWKFLGDIFTPPGDEQKNKSNLKLIRQDPISDPMENEVALEEALEVIRWYQYQINIKILRAIESKKNEDSLELNDFPKDSDGSAKVSLLGIDRSISSWNALMRHLPEQKERILSLSIHLSRLRERVESEFPNARAFIRKGFDEIK